MKINKINKFNLDVKNFDQSFFGEYQSDFINEKWDSFRNKETQLNLFKQYNDNIKLNITDFWMSTMCPKMFEAYFITKILDRPPNHPPILELGTVIDKTVKDYLRNIANATDEDLIKENSYEYLETRLKRLSTQSLKEYEIDKYLDAFVDFIDTFRDFKLITDVSSKVKVDIDKISFSGDFDLLLEHKESKKIVLLDLKLQKFGRKIEDLKLYEILQVILYTLALKKREIKVDTIGYYYFVERTFIVDSDIVREDLEAFITKIVKGLLHTQNFKPKECFLCFICKLKNNCIVGKNLSPKNVYNPLLYKQMK